MTLPKELLSLLVCPISLAPVRLSGDGKWVVCPQSQMQYPIRDGVPIMVAEEGVKMGQISSEEEGGAMSTEKAVVIYVAEGKNKGLEVSLPIGACRAIGRSLDDMESTRVFDTSGVLGLDDSTKQLVMNYVTKQFQGQDAVVGDIGSFRRMPDISLSDHAISRLHAMVFHGPNGVGVLDLVSKNGTFVNGAEVESKFISADDVVTVGSSKLRINLSES